FADSERKRRFKSVTSVEFAGRWSLMRSHNLDESDFSGPSRQYHEAAQTGPLTPTLSPSEGGEGEHSYSARLSASSPSPPSEGERAGVRGPIVGTVEMRPLRGPAAEIAKTEEVRTAAIESFARALLRRYGIVFRRLLEREAFKIS